MPESTGADNGWSGLRWRLAGWGTAAALLLLPALAMQVTDEVNWTRGDFIFAGALLLAVGVAYELAASSRRSREYRAAVGVALAAALLLVWANGAVGIIGAETNPANLMYGGVLAVGAVGAVMARFRPGGMAIALLATSLAQALVAVVALIGGMGSAGDLLLATTFFVGLWVASAAFFRRAAREEASASARL